MFWQKRKNNKKVFVGLSGGVDSAVSAALLKGRGFDVSGVFIKVWQPDFLPCNWREERRDAMKVALALNIPFLFFDFEAEYKKGVAHYIIREYSAGRTPNPDVLCNREIKFNAFWQKARELGAQYIATGHYAIKKEGQEGYQLYAGKDIEKDQSYFLWTLNQKDLSHTLFPVGELQKQEVRNLAKKYKLPVAEKKDSQGICFLGDVSMEDFLGHFVESKPGKVLNIKGEVIGHHKGAIFYTIGERHGFEVEKKDPLSGPFYVVKKDMQANTITVSNILKEIRELSPKKIVVKGFNWITEPTGPDLMTRIRYRGQKVSAELSLNGRDLMVSFKEPQRGLSVGQSIVFYRDDLCLGGGVMDRIVE